MQGIPITVMYICSVARIEARNNRYIREGDEILEVETEKASHSINSPASGILRLLVQQFEEVKPDHPIAVIDVTTNFIIVKLIQ